MQLLTANFKYHLTASDIATADCRPQARLLSLGDNHFTAIRADELSVSAEAATSYDATGGEFRKRREDAHNCGGY